MAEQGDLQAPGWLQRNWQPKEPFDPTPWLQERFKNEIIKAKLPLELQQMALHNKASQLSIEHQGIENDQLNKELDLYAADLPALRDWQDKMVDDPGISPPAVRSNQARAAIAAAQRNSLESNLGQAIHQQILDQTRGMAEIVKYTGRVLERMPNGLYDPKEYNEALKQAEDAKFARDVALRKAGTDWHSSVNSLDKITESARHIADLKAQMRDAQQEMASRAGDLPLVQYARAANGDTYDANESTSKILRLKDEIDALERIQSRRQAGGLNGYAPDVTMKQALELQDAGDALDAAIESGDPLAIRRAATLERNLKARQAAQHRDPRDVEQLRVLRNRVTAIDRLLANPLQRKMFPELQGDRDAAAKALADYQFLGSDGGMNDPYAPAGDNEDAGSPSSMDEAPAPAPTAAPAVKTRVFKNGRFVD